MPVLHLLGALAGAGLIVFGFVRSGGRTGLAGLVGAGLMLVGLILVVISLLLGFVPDFLSA